MKVFERFHVVVIDRREGADDAAHSKNLQELNAHLNNQELKSMNGKMENSLSEKFEVERSLPTDEGGLHAMELPLSDCFYLV